MRNMKSLFHINLPVNDWDKMVDFYVNVCEFDQAFVLTVADMNKMFGKPVKEGDEKIGQLTYIRVSPDSYLELANAKASGKTVINDPGSAFHHMAFLVEDIAETAKKMAAKGYPLISSPLDPTPVDVEKIKERVGADGCIIAWLIDPEGHKIEVMQQTGSTAQERFEKEHPYAD